MKKKQQLRYNEANSGLSGLIGMLLGGIFDGLLPAPVQENNIDAIDTSPEHYCEEEETDSVDEFLSNFF